MRKNYWTSRGRGQLAIYLSLDTNCSIYILLWRHIFSYLLLVVFKQMNKLPLLPSQTQTDVLRQHLLVTGCDAGREMKMLLWWTGRYGCDSVTGVAQSWHVTYLSQCHNITSQQQLRQGQTERFSALLNCSNNRRAKLNWWSDLNNKRQIIKNIWKIFIDLTSSFLAAHNFSTFKPDQLYP